MSSSSSSTTTTTARVSSRRGSVSAPDPYGTHLELNMSPTRAISSKLSIVRVVPVPAAPFHLDQPPSSAAHRRHHHFSSSSSASAAAHSHRRHGSGSSIGSNHGGGTTTPSNNNGGNGSGNGSNGGGGGGSPRLSFASSSFAAPGSPTLLASVPRSASPTHTRHTSISGGRPRLTPEQILAIAHDSSSPRATPNSIGGGHTLASPVPSPGGGPLGPALVAEHAHFTELADDVFLPFVNRAEEVSALFSGPPCSKLLTLLSQTFAGSPLSSPSIPASSSAAAYDLSVFDTDPRRWSAPQLAHWLKRVDRDRAPDALWVARARACVLEHSELIWQRIKGALGVPPELDVDEESAGHSLGGVLDVDVMASLPSAISSSSMPTAGDTPEPSPLPPREVDVAGEKEHEGEGEEEEEEEPMSPMSLTIEPIFAGTLPATAHDLPPTRPGAHTLADCVEEEEDENEEEAESGEHGRGQKRQSIPPDVRGILIRTTPSSPSIFGAVPAPSSLSSPPLAALAGHPGSPPAVSASPALSAIALPPPISASDLAYFASIHGAGARAGSRARSGSAASARSTGSRRYSYGSEDGGSTYNPVGERGPGNPLFPSTFARLALGPTLSANNPSLRNPRMPPPNRFGSPHGIRGRRAGPGSGSWVDGAGSESGRYEYALTLASESSGRSFVGTPA